MQNWWKMCLQRRMSASEESGSKHMTQSCVCVFVCVRACTHESTHKNITQSSLALSLSLSLSPLFLFSLSL